MTSAQDAGGPADRREQAADWFARLNADSAVEADWLAFEQWLAADPENGAAYEAMERLWVELDDTTGELARALAEPAAEPSAALIPISTARPKRPRVRAPWIGGLAAAAAAAGLVLTFGPDLWRPAAPAAVIYAAPAGRPQVIQLPDGSRVHLNGGSRLSVVMEKDARRVSMGDAEASFDVAKDPARPFLIAAGDRQVRVVGTEFNVLHHDGRLVVTVRRGVVAVGAPGAAPEARLEPGWQLVHEDGREASQLRKVNADTAFAWWTGRLVYEDRPLPEVVADLNRYFSTPIRVEGAAAQRLRFSGVLVVDQEDAVLRRLETFLPVRVEHDADGVVLRAKPAR